MHNDDNRVNGDELVNRILDHSADRIRFNTRSSEGELSLAQGATAHIGRYQSGIGIAATTQPFTEELASVELHGSQPIIRAGPRNAITVQYQSLPNKDKPFTMRLPPRLPAPLLEPSQLKEAATNNAGALRRGVTRAYLTDHDTGQPGIKAQGTEIGFSNQAVYQSQMIYDTKPENTLYMMPGEQPGYPKNAAHRIDIPNQS